MKVIHLCESCPDTGPSAYTVVRLKNDAKFSIGQVLDRAAVQDLCDFSEIWAVHIEGVAP